MHSLSHGCQGTPAPPQGKTALEPTDTLIQDFWLLLRGRMNSRYFTPQCVVTCHMVGTTGGGPWEALGLTPDGESVWEAWGGGRMPRGTWAE